MRKILAPHKEQDGWVYVRVPKLRQVSNGVQYPIDIGHVTYADTGPENRIISSRTAETAVELYEYMCRCDDECLIVTKGSCIGPRLEARWLVLGEGYVGFGATLREAYHLYHGGRDGK